MEYIVSGTQISGGTKVKKKSETKQTIRTRDLTTRERVNFVVSTEIMAKLRDRSEKDDMPMSRIVDTALSQYLDSDRTDRDMIFHSKTLETGINLYHSLEIILSISFNSNFTKEFTALMENYFHNFTYSSCLLKDSLNESIVGTRFFSFIADTQQEELIGLLNEPIVTEQKQEIKMMLDMQPLHL